MAFLRPRTFRIITSFPRARVASNFIYRNSASFARNMASTTTTTSAPDDLSSIFTEETSRSILDFWFEDCEQQPGEEQRIRLRWFQPNTEFDEQCRSKFALLLSKMVTYPASSIISLATSPERALALVVLLDQIPRNIFRDDLSVKVYTESDPLAVALSLHSLSPPLRYDLGPNNAWKTDLCKRLWFAFPLSHSEDLALHKRAMEKPGILEDCLEEEAKEGTSPGLSIAKTLESNMIEHKTVIERFGRYPYRNKVLGREDTPEERTWLEESKPAWAR